MGQPQHIANAAATALTAVFDITGDLMYAGIQLDTVRGQDHNAVGRNFDAMLLDQMITDFDKRLLYLTARDIKNSALNSGEGELDIHSLPGPEVKDLHDGHT